MRGFITQDKRYYEIDNGPNDPSDREVPIRPAEHYTWVDGKGWMGARGSSDAPDILKMKITLQQVITLLIAVVGLACTGYGIVLGVGARMDVQDAKMQGAMNAQQIQIQGVKDTTAAGFQGLHMEVEDLKKRLDSHIEKSHP